jgi:hypothetical protein
VDWKWTVRWVTAVGAPYRDVEAGDSSVARGVELRLGRFRYRGPRGDAVGLVHGVHGSGATGLETSALVGMVQGRAGMSGPSGRAWDPG